MSDCAHNTELGAGLVNVNGRIYPVCRGCGAEMPAGTPTTECAPALPDPARTLAELDQETEVLPTLPAGELNIGDRIVREIMVMQVAGEWDGRRSADMLAQRYNQDRSAILARASEAGRHLRIQRAPDVMFEWLVAELRNVVSQSIVDRVPAIKLLLEQLEKVEKRRGNRPQDKLTPEQERERLGALLDDPPPELVAILEAKWGPRR